jgi:hypothetical protein
VKPPDWIALVAIVVSGAVAILAPVLTMRIQRRHADAAAERQRRWALEDAVREQVREVYLATLEEAARCTDAARELKWNSVPIRIAELEDLEPDHESRLAARRDALASPEVRELWRDFSDRCFVVSIRAQGFDVLPEEHPWYDRSLPVDDFVVEAYEQLRSQVTAELRGDLDSGRG